MTRDRVTRALRIAKLAHSLGEYDSNVIGMVGEVITEDVLRMTKAPKQSKDIDGILYRDNEHRSVQVKALSSSRLRRYAGRAKFRLSAGAHPQHLVVLLVLSEHAAYEILYDGPAQNVGRLEVVKGVQRRGIRVDDLFAGKESELNAIVRRCKGDA